MAFSEACSYFSLKDHIEHEEEYAKCENILRMLLTHWDDKEAYFLNKTKHQKPFLKTPSHRVPSQGSD